MALFNKKRKKGTKKMINEWKDLRFNLTEDMNNTMIQMLITQQMLREIKDIENF